jgi:N-acetylglucosaminyl-diphospho-decaprenol L-rhamnosyltransferase
VTHLTAVLVAYRTPELLRQCLAALEDSALVDRIVVADNSVPDTEPRDVALSFGKVTHLPLPSNVGFAKAVNAALDEVGAGHVLLINPDCLLEPHALQDLVNALEQHPRSGVVAPWTVSPSRKLGVLAAGRQPTLWRVFTHYSGLSVAFPRQTWAEGWNFRAAAHGDRVREVEWASGACLLIREGVFDQVGPLNERWFMYAEDMEFCLRVRRAGWQVLHVPSARASHVIGAASEDGPVSTRWVSTLVDYYDRQWRPGPIARLLYRAVLGTGLAARAAACRARGIRARGEARESWRREAHKNLVCARRAWSPRRGQLDVPPEQIAAGEVA